MITTILAFLLVLGVLIFVHELGHFLVARWYGVRVVTFSLGFGPKILKFTRGDTEYCVSAVPLGGYVKMAGETVQDERVGAPDEFLSKSKWIRFQVYLAGPAMNILLAIVAGTVVLSNGADVPRYLSQAPVVGSVVADSPASKAGLQAGDRIVSIDGAQMPTWSAMERAVLPKANRELSFTIERAGQQQTIKVTPEAEGRFGIGRLGVIWVKRPQIIRVVPGTPGERAGLKRGDVVLAVGGQTDLNKDRIVDIVGKHGPNPLVFTVERDGRPMDITVTPEGAAGSSKVGFYPVDYEFDHVDPSLGEAFQLSLKQNWEDSREIGRTLKGLFTRETPINQLVGPLGIAELSGSAAQLGWITLLGLMATISLNLALLNLMPVPVLDGGQIAILALEGITRRDMSVRMKERFAMVGAALILMLMVAVLYNDFARILR